jgi:hypothetical protein
MGSLLAERLYLRSRTNAENHNNECNQAINMAISNPAQLVINAAVLHVKVLTWVSQTFLIDVQVIIRHSCRREFFFDEFSCSAS